MGESAVERDELLGTTPFLDYNGDEHRYSVHVRNTLLELLKGDRDELALLAKYHRDSRRLGILPPPENILPAALRLPKVEEILSETIRFLHDGSEGGPIAQSSEDGAGVILQRRDFPTRFPHMVIQRTDVYTPESASSWRVAGASIASRISAGTCASIRCWTS